MSFRLITLIVVCSLAGCSSEQGNDLQQDYAQTMSCYSALQAASAVMRATDIAEGKPDPGPRASLLSDAETHLDQAIVMGRSLEKDEAHVSREFAEAYVRHLKEMGGTSTNELRKKLVKDADLLVPCADLRSRYAQTN